MILVTGATGHFGNAAINYLLAKGVEASSIKALVRTDQAGTDFQNKGIHVVVGNYDNYESLVAAMVGVDKLLFVSGNDIAKRMAQHQNIINAAKASDVKHVVYTSFQRKNETETSPLWIVAQSHIQTEQWIKESGIAYTILKNNLYMDFLPGFIGEKVLETGTIFVPAQNGKISAVLRSEMAEAAANILIAENQGNKEYDFTNNEATSYQDIAQTIASASGKSIQYISPSADEYTKVLTSYGVPAEVVGVFTSFAVAQAQGELDMKSNDLEILLGRKPVSVIDYISGIYGAKE